MSADVTARFRALAPPAEAAGGARRAQRAQAAVAFDLEALELVRLALPRVSEADSDRNGAAFASLWAAAAALARGDGGHAEGSAAALPAAQDLHSRQGRRHERAGQGRARRGAGKGAGFEPRRVAD